MPGEIGTNTDRFPFKLLSKANNESNLVVVDIQECPCQIFDIWQPRPYFVTKGQKSGLPAAPTVTVCNMATNLNVARVLSELPYTKMSACANFV